jgi:GR25 family glycosyltransferase involved in LPS biosynthesis
LNLPERTDRLQQFKDAFKEWNLELEVVPAIKHAEGWKGCALSHRAAIQKAKDAGLPWVLILEDDAAPTDATPGRFNSLLPILWERRSEWDVFNGAPTNVKQEETSILRREDPPLLKTKGQAAHFILMNGAAFDRVLSEVQEASLPIIDLYYREQMRMWATYPHIAIQQPGLSNIQGNQVDYRAGFNTTNAALKQALSQSGGSKRRYSRRRRSRSRSRLYRRTQRRSRNRNRTKKQRGGGGGTSDLPRQIWCLWLGSHPMSETRAACLKSVKSVTGVPVVLITDETLPQYIRPEHPLHKAYQYLSGTHKADYMRIYMLYHYGGGYADIKTQTGSWVPAFEEMERDPSIWMSGYPEVDKNGVAVFGLSPERADELKANWAKLIGNGAYIARAGSPLLAEVVRRQNAALDKHYDVLVQHPAVHPRDGEGGSTSGYPIFWSEILGSIFHDVSFNDISHIRQSVPTPKFTGYI